MASDQAAFLKLPPLTVSALLRQLVSLRRRASSGEDVKVPQVTLHLRSGRDVQGKVLDQAAADRGGGVLVQVGVEPRDAVYLDPHGVEAITVHEANALEALLAPPPSPPTPSRAVLTQRAEELGNSLSMVLGHAVEVEIAWDQVPDGEPMRALAAVMEETANAIREIARDDMGRQSLVGVRTLRFNAGRRPSVKLEAGALVSTAALDRGPERTLTSTELRIAIESVL